MSKNNKSKMDAFIEKSLLFQGAMGEFQKTTERRLDEATTSLKSIEVEVQKPRMCGAHESVLTMIAHIREGETRQESTNISQNAKNAARTVEQTAQDVKIRDLEEQDRVIEVKLSPRQEMKINYTLAAGVGSMAIWIFTYIMRYFGYQI